MSQAHVDFVKESLSDGNSETNLNDFSISEDILLLFSDDLVFKDENEYDPEQLPEEIKSPGIYKIDETVYIVLDNGMWMTSFQLCEQAISTK